MRRIRKTHPPKEFRAWLRENQGADCSYPALVGKPAHAALKDCLIQEQGFLCAYTGREVDQGSSHVEHIKPQNRCEENEDVDYRNMLACFPADGGDRSCGYGAPVKSGWWDEALFVSPLSDDCERRFTFAWSGKVYPFPSDHPAAIKTIKVLGLNHDNLRELRRKAINGFFGFGARATPLSRSQATFLLRGIDRLNSSGRLTPFCFVLKPLLESYVTQREKHKG